MSTEMMKREELDVGANPHQAQELHNMICTYANKHNMSYAEAERLFIAAIGEGFSNG